MVSDGNAEMRRLIDQCHFDAAVDGTVADSVLHQIGEGAAQQVGVAAQDGRIHRGEGQADLLGVGREPGQVDHFGEQVVEVVLLGLDGLDLGARVGQEAVGEFQRAARLAGQLIQTGATFGAVGGGAQLLDDGQDGGLGLVLGLLTLLVLAIRDRWSINVLTYKQGREYSILDQ